MKRLNKRKGALTIETSISYSIFLMVIVTILYIMRIVYVHGLIQHAVSQTAKELSMYTYIYQVTGINDTYQDIQNSVEDRTGQFNKDAENVVSLYESFSSGDFSGSYEGTVNPVDILKNIGSVMLGEGSSELNKQMFTVVVRPLIEGYIGADSRGNSAHSRLQALRVIGGMDGLDFSSSSFFEDGATIDLVVCYTLDPLFPIDIMPEINLANRACVRGMSGKAVFSRNEESGTEKEEPEKSVWDLSPLERGKAIQEQQGIRNLPDNFPVYSAYDSSSGTATAELSIDLREETYQDKNKLTGDIRNKCNKILNFKKSTVQDVSLAPEDIKNKVLIIYIPSSKGREIDRTDYDAAIKNVQEFYPDIQIITKEID